MNGRFEIKCNATNGGEIVLVEINLPAHHPPNPPPPPPPQVVCTHIYTEEGVLVECSTRRYTITGMSYFVNGIPIGITR